jgi:hypothetical protein
MVKGIRRALVTIGRLYIAFSLGGVVVSYLLFGWMIERAPVVTLIEGLVLWLTLALPPYIAAHALCAVLARAGERLWPRRRARIYVQGRPV